MERWEAAGLWHNMRATINGADSFNEATFNFLASMNAEQKADFFCLLWCIWRRRNDTVWKDTEVRAHIVVSLSREYMHDWYTMRSKMDKATMHISNASDLIWTPKTCEFKCNSDAALFFQEGMFGLGLCVRNDHGEFVTAKTLWFASLPTPKEAEAIGLLEAVKWVRELDFTQIIFELDCKAVVDDILESQEYNNEYGTILNNCKEQLNFSQNYEVSYVRRQTNFVAHSLARASTLYASHHVFNSIPSCIGDLLMNEMA